MQRRRMMLVQGDKIKDLGRYSKEEKGDATIVKGSATMLESALTRRILQGMIITTTTIMKAMAMKGTIGSKTSYFLSFGYFGSLVD